MIRGSSIPALVARRITANVEWTCFRCRAQLPNTGKPIQSRAPISRNYATARLQPTASKPRSRRRAVILASAGGVLGASVLAFGDDIKTTYEATERSLRVASTLFICVNE